MCISDTKIQEEISLSVVKSIAAYAGYNITIPTNDYGIDGSFEEILIRDGRQFASGLRLDFQLKSTYNFNIANGNVSYNLKVKNYNDLVTTETYSPRILLLYTMPKRKNMWLIEKNKGIIYMNRIFWINLKGNPYSKNNYAQNIKIPITQTFTVNSLIELMGKIKAGEIW